MDPFTDGFEAHGAGKSETANPHDREKDTNSFMSWDDGWQSAADEAAEA